MNKIILITLCAFFLISATVTEVGTMIIQPKIPKSVKTLSGYISYANSDDLNGALNTYTRMGYVVKTTSYNSNGCYLIILEKY